MAASKAFVNAKVADMEAVFDAKLSELVLEVVELKQSGGVHADEELKDNRIAELEHENAELTEELERVKGVEGEDSDDEGWEAFYGESWKDSKGVIRLWWEQIEEKDEQIAKLEQRLDTLSLSSSTTPAHATAPTPTPAATPSSSHSTPLKSASRNTPVLPRQECAHCGKEFLNKTKSAWSSHKNRCSKKADKSDGCPQ